MSASVLFIKHLLKNEIVIGGITLHGSTFDDQVLLRREFLSVSAVSHGCTCGDMPFLESSMPHWYVSRRNHVKFDSCV